MKIYPLRSAILVCLILLTILAIPVQAVTWISASGCWTATDGTYNLVMWNATGATSWTAPAGVTSVEYLVAAGGGSGAVLQTSGGGGGGAGGISNATGLAVTAGTSYNVTVGAGGAQVVSSGAGLNGQGSRFSSIITTGGYGGSSSSPYNGGASGGGNAGGAGSAGNANGGGGGGAGSVGADAGPAYYVAGNGGDGRSYYITGAAMILGGGGGGGAKIQDVAPLGSPGSGGSGIGGDGISSKSGAHATDGVTSTGSGGGGAAWNTPFSTVHSGAGGSGLVIIRYSIVDPPTVTTQATGSITGTTATGYGTIVDIGSASPTHRGVCWNTGGSPTTADSKVDETGTFGTGAFSESITGLTKGQKYYLRAYATNTDGTAYGEEVNFTTLIEPTVTTQAATVILSTSATGNGNIISIGGVNATVRGICWNTVGTPTIADSKAEESGSFGTGAFTEPITGLTTGTPYFARAYATNSVGTSYGAEITFTPANIVVTTDTTTDIYETSATGHGNITTVSASAPTVRGFAYGIGANPTIAGDHVQETGTYGVGAYSLGISGLSASTTYHIRAFATNDEGTVYGADDTFLTTTPLPTSDRIGFGATSNQTGIQGSNGFNNGIYSYNGVTESTVGTAYADDFATNTSFRYATALYNTSATVVSGDPNVLSGKFTMTTNTYTMAIGRLKSYKFGGGVYEFNFDNNNDGGSVTDFNGAVIAESDLDNFYRVAVGNDTVAGTSNISIYKKVAGTLTLINVTGTNSTYIRSNKTWMKIKFDPKNNILDAWVRDDTGSYPTAANVRGVVNSGFNNSYFGFYSMVGTNGPENLNVDFDDLTINSELVVGFTNIPDTVNGGFIPMYRNAAIGAYWNGTAVVQATRYTDDFNFPTIAEYTQVYRTWTVDTTNGVLSGSSSPALLSSKQKYSSGYYDMGVYFTATPASTDTVRLIFGWDGTNNGAGLPSSGYAVVLRFTASSPLRITKYVSGGSSDLSTTGVVAPSQNTPYKITALWNADTGAITATVYNQDNSVFASTTATDTTYQSANYTGVFQTSITKAKITSLNINAIEITSPSGINAGIDSVAHGAMYDTANTASIAGYAPITVQFKDVGGQYKPINPVLTRNWTYQGIVAGNNTQKTFATSSAPYAEFGEGNWSIKLNNEDISGTKESPQTFWINVTPSSIASFTTDKTSGVTPLTVTVTDTSTNSPTSYLWYVDETPYTTSTIAPQTFVSVGTHKINLTVSNPSLSPFISTYSKNIYVNQTSGVDFNGTPTSGYAVSDVVFVDMSTGSGLSAWLWDFGDGGTSTTRNTTHTYTAPGNYTVSLTVTGLDGQYTKTMPNYITMSVAPDINTDSTLQFKADPNIIRNLSVYTRTIQADHIQNASFINGTTLFDKDNIMITSVAVNATTYADLALTSYSIDNSTGVIAFNISRTGNFFDSIVTPTSIVDIGMLYDRYKSGVTGAGWGSGVLGNYTYLSTSPVAHLIDSPLTYSWTTFSNFTVNNNTPVIGETVVTFTPVEYTYLADRFSWNFGDGNVTLALTGAPITHIYITPPATLNPSLTTYLIADPAGTTNITTLTGAIVPLWNQTYIHADFSAQPTTGTPGVAVIFTDLSQYGDTAGLVYNWSFGDDLYSASPYSNIIGNVTHVYPVAGTYSVNITISNIHGSDSEVKLNYIVVSTDQNTLTTFYTPQLYRFTFQNLLGVPLGGLSVTITPLNLTMPVTWEQQLFAISPSVNLQGGVISGITGSTGTFGAPLFTSLGYMINISGTAQSGDVVDYSIIEYPPSQGGDIFISLPTSMTGFITITPTPAFITYDIYNQTISNTTQTLSVNFNDPTCVTNLTVVTVTNQSGYILNQTVYTGTASCNIKNNFTYVQGTTSPAGDIINYGLSAYVSTAGGWNNISETYDSNTGSSLTGRSTYDQWVAIIIIVLVSSAFTASTVYIGTFGVGLMGLFFYYVTKWFTPGVPGSVFITMCVFWMCIGAIGIIAKKGRGGYL